jgi:hypothetical protein
MAKLFSLPNHSIKINNKNGITILKGFTSGIEKSPELKIEKM